MINEGTSSPSLYTAAGTRPNTGTSLNNGQGQSAYGMGSLDATTGSSQPWAANQRIRDATSTGTIMSLRSDGQRIYGSGYAFGTGSNFEGTFVTVWASACCHLTRGLVSGKLLTHLQSCAWLTLYRTGPTGRTS